MTDKPKRKSSRRQTRNKPTAPAEPYEPTSAEVAQKKALDARKADRPAPPRVKLNDFADNMLSLLPDHPDPQTWVDTLKATHGTTSRVLADALFQQLMNVIPRQPGESPSESECNAILAAVHGIAPRDETEGMLAVQMVAAHRAAMKMLERAIRAQQQNTLTDAGNLAIKFLRTYTAQMEALQRYRGKGQQKVTVEHVHVYKGGQAIVGTVNGRGAGGAEKSEDQSHAMWRENPEGDAMPDACNGQRALPDARRH